MKGAPNSSSILAILPIIPSWNTTMPFFWCVDHCRYTRLLRLLWGNWPLNNWFSSAIIGCRLLVQYFVTNKVTGIFPTPKLVMKWVTMTIDWLLCSEMCSEYDSMYFNSLVFASLVLVRSWIKFIFLSWNIFFIYRTRYETRSRNVRGTRLSTVYVCCNGYKQVGQKCVGMYTTFSILWKIPPRFTTTPYL